ncbi:MAG TPA: Clp protease N-terminal domain-containing protein [Gemmataceae bacterium]|nr:Clp protease N-terminal domain-containing protein [Gemmataceae bacterium]
MNEAARFEHFTDRARKALALANQEALRLCHEYLGTEHILLGIVQEGSGIAANVLKNLDIDLLAIKREVEKIVPPGQQIGPQRNLPWTPRTKKVIEYATEEAAKFGLKRVGTEHLFLGLLREEESIAAEVLTNLGVRFEQVVEEILNLHGGMDYAAEGTLRTRARSRTPALDSFGRDLTLLARRGRLDPVIGRSNEIEEVLLVLGCRHRNRPLLVAESLGDADAVVEGLAQRIVSGNVPYELTGSRVVALDSGYILMLQTEREQAAVRLRAILNEARRARVLLFLSDLRSLLEATVPGLDALFRATLRYAPPPLIAAVTPSDLRTYIEPEAAVRDAFQTVLVRPPERADVLAILEALRDRLETHHCVQFTDGALRAAVERADRSLSGPSLKDSALQVLDRAGALRRLRSGCQPPELKGLDAQIERLDREKETAVAEQDFEKAAHLREQAETVSKRREALLDEWRQDLAAAQGVVDEELVKEIVARMAPQPF